MGRNLANIPAAAQIDLLLSHPREAQLGPAPAPTQLNPVPNPAPLPLLAAHRRSPTHPHASPGLHRLMLPMTFPLAQGTEAPRSRESEGIEEGNLSPKSERIKNCNELKDYLQIPLGNGCTS
jgi:hypothetical protein